MGIRVGYKLQTEMAELENLLDKIKYSWKSFINEVTAAKDRITELQAEVEKTSTKQQKIKKPQYKQLTREFWDELKKRE